MTWLKHSIGFKRAVHLLCEQGYRPFLFYIKIGKDDTDYMDCSVEEDVEMASVIARRYGLHLEVVDLHHEYWNNVAAYAILYIIFHQVYNACFHGILGGFVRIVHV